MTSPTTRSRQRSPSRGVIPIDVGTGRWFADVIGRRWVERVDEHEEDERG